MCFITVRKIRSKDIARNILQEYNYIDYGAYSTATVY